jgi:hypothetical protein
VSSQVRSEWEERDQHMIHMLLLEMSLPSSLASLELAASPFPLRSPNLLPLWRFGAAAGAAILCPGFEWFMKRKVGFKCPEYLLL